MNIDRIIDIIRTLKEEGMGTGALGGPTNKTGPQIAGLPPDSPPVFKKRPPILARGLMPGARTRWRQK